MPISTSLRESKRNLRPIAVTDSPLQPRAESQRDSQALVSWYRDAKRDLPWRKNRDPYRIWVSEVMLQQTTVAAVVPYYDRFMTRFPNLKALAEAPLEDVLEHWAGLGYYSRARNLHKAAQALAENGFPRTFTELLELPGFGPYTARAVSSLAFDEKTGVLDGNVIRVLSRRLGVSLEWWKPKGRDALQKVADQLAEAGAPSDVNQGLMELGAMVCTVHSPTCWLCPWAKTCVARSEDTMASLPLKKPRREREIWLWSPSVIEKNNHIFLIENDYAPFLKGHWILPGSVQKLKKPPKAFSYKGTVTHHDIFVQVQEASKTERLSGRWVAKKNLEKEIPASLIRKAILALQRSKKNC